MPYVWTRGYILNLVREIAEGYEIVEQDGVEYLLMEWKNGDYVYGRRKELSYYIFVHA